MLGDSIVCFTRHYALGYYGALVVNRVATYVLAGCLENWQQLFFEGGARYPGGYPSHGNLVDCIRFDIVANL